MSRVSAALRGVVIALLVARAAAAAPAVPVIEIGDGPSLVVEYDRDFKPLRKLRGLHKPSDLTPLADGGLLLVDQDAHEVLQLDAAGAVRWRQRIGLFPVRARLRPGGGLLVTGLNEIVATYPDLSVEWQRSAPGVRTAVPLANGNILLTRNAAYGELVEMKPDGSVVWQSEPPGHTDATGQWIDTDPKRFFSSVSSLDVAADGTIFTTDFDHHQLRVLAPDYRLLRAMSIVRHVEDTRIGPGGELIAVSPEDYRVWISRPDNSQKLYEPDLRPTCANLSARGTVFVGLEWEPEVEWLNATAARAAAPPDVPWWRRALPVPILGALAALLIAGLLRWREARELWRRGMRHPAADAAPEAIPTPPAARPLRWAVMAFLVVVLAGGVYVAWASAREITARGFDRRSWEFAAGCVAAAVALRILNAMAGAAGTLSSFVASQWTAPTPRGDRGRLAVLLVLAIASLAGCVAVLRLAPQEQAIAVALWLAGQIWVVAAAFPPRRAETRRSRSLWLALALLVLAAALRFWQIGYYPDHVHHDHGMFGHEVLRAMRGEWQPFFSRVYSIGRPWLVPVMAAFEVFGREYWVLRLSAAVSGVAVVWGTYLLGGVLFNARVAVIAALLVCVNHVLLLYSRQPYVLDPVPPFVFALYCAAIGLRRGCRFHWCLAGVLSGWALLGYYASVTYVPVGAALLLYLAVFYPRALWRQRSGLLWLVLGGCMVYLPMQAQSMADTIVAQRASEIVVFLNPDGSIRWDPTLWAHQLGHSFGAILYYSESAWGVSTGESICMRDGAVLFGVGLGYLLLWWRTPATFLVLAWGVICIFLGSAVLPAPPTHYHFLAALVPIMLASGVALDRMLALTDGWRPRWWRLPAQAGALALLAAISAANLTAVWAAVRRPLGPDGRSVFAAEGAVMAARYVREHPEYHHYLVRKREDVSALAGLFRFFASDSDLSDLTTKLEDTLPIAPVDPAPGAAFIVLPSRAEERAVIERVYPTARVEEIACLPPGTRVWVYLVDAATVRQAAGK